MRLDLKLKENKIIYGDKEIELTIEQLEALGIRLNPFDIKDGEKYYYIEKLGKVYFSFYDENDKYNTSLLESGKACKDEKLMKQKALRQNLSDLLWKFTIENGWSDEQLNKSNAKKYEIIYFDDKDEFRIDYYFTGKVQGTIAFTTKDIAQRAIDEIVKPFIEENPDFVW